MVGVVKGILGIFLFLFITTLAYAMPTVNVSVSGIPNVAKLSEAKDMGLTASVYLSCVGCERIVRSTEYLEVYVVREPQAVVYQDILPINTNRSRLIIYNIPGEIFADEGIYYIRFIYRALTTLGSEIRVSRELSVLVTEVENSALKVLRVSPDLNRDTVFRLERTQYTFRVEIFNTYEDMQIINAKVELLDNIGRIVLSRSVNTRIHAFQRSFVEIPVDFTLLPAGEYTIVLTVNRGPYEVYRVERKVILGEDYYVPVRIYEIKQYPFTVKAGEFLELKLLLKNIEDNPTVIKIILQSRELGIYRETETIEFDAREVKELNYVIRIPKNVEPKDYYLDVIVQAGTATRKYTYRLYVEGEKPKPVEVKLIKPLRLELGKEEEIKLIFKSNVEALNEYRIRVFSENAEVVYPATLTIGGKGNVIEVPIKVKPTSLRTTVLIEVYDTNGNLIFDAKETFSVALRTEKMYEYAVKILLLVALVILAIVLYYAIESRRKKKRKIEKAE